MPVTSTYIYYYLLSEMVWKMTLQETWMIWVSIFAWSWICGHGLDDALAAIDGRKGRFPSNTEGLLLLFGSQWSESGEVSLEDKSSLINCIQFQESDELLAYQQHTDLQLALREIDIMSNHQ